MIFLKLFIVIKKCVLVLSCLALYNAGIENKSFSINSEKEVNIWHFLTSSVGAQRHLQRLSALLAVLLAVQATRLELLVVLLAVQATSQRLCQLPAVQLAEHLTNNSNP
jgi:hypothetical protein